jgi:hypothetical protein
MSSESAPRDLGIAGRLTRSRGRGPRDKNANARVTAQELTELHAAAKADGKAFGEWTRDALIAAARTKSLDTAIFTELMAFRLFSNGVLRALSTGRTLSEKDFAALLTEARENKHLAVAQTLSQYQPTAGVTE